MANQVKEAYEIAKERYAKIGVDTDAALKRLAGVAISMHCWQGDDVGGFENPDGELTGGIQSTGNYPGKASNPTELRQDFEKAHSLIPGTHRIALHAIYGETDGKGVPRDQVKPEHFKNWVDWAKKLGLGIDMNPTYFSHPLSADGMTLSHPNKDVRDFWIRHGIACREIGAYMGKELNNPCVNNHWVPDGLKDTPVDRYGPRLRLKEAYDEIFKPNIDPKNNLDAVECKLFGIGAESYTSGSHEFYMGYAVANKKLLCLDAGHFHPTETISDKISSIMLFVDEILLHVSRPVRWDSDHVVTLTDDLCMIAAELVRNEGFLGRTHIGLDFFDGSINRIAAWVIGTRNMIKALLIAMLEPTKALVEAEKKFDLTTRLACLEDLKAFPWGAVWDYYCMQNDVPVGNDWLPIVRDYESKVLATR